MLNYTGLRTEAKVADHTKLGVNRSQRDGVLNDNRLGVAVTLCTVRLYALPALILRTRN